MNRFNRKEKRLEGRLFGLLVLGLLVQAAIIPAQAADPTPTPKSTPASVAAQPTTQPLPGPPVSTPRSATIATTPTPFPTITRRPTLAISPSPSPTAGPKLQSVPPNVRAVSAIAVDADTGQILYAKDIHARRAMASTTKITTALSFLSLYPSQLALQAETVVTQDDLVGEANMGLRKDEHIRLSTVLLGLLTNSANESGMVLARYAGARLAGPADPVDRFVAYMNTYVLSLGMYESHYMNPHGLDQPGHYTTAYDLSIAGWWALHNSTFLQNAEFTAGEVDSHSFYNVNTFLSRYPGATGLKPGLTDDAGHCLVASARNNGHNVIVVVLNDPYMAADTDALMDYSFTLLAGRASQPLSTVSLGNLSIPNSGLKGGQGAVSGRAIEAALRVQTDYSLRLTLATFVSP